MARLKSKTGDETSTLFDPSDDPLIIESSALAAMPPQLQLSPAQGEPTPDLASLLAPQLIPALAPLDDLFCPRQISFTIPGTPGVQVTATENGGSIDFTVDVLDSSTLTGDLRGLFFQFNESKLGSLQVTGGDGLITGSQINANAVINLGNGNNMNGAASPFDVGIAFGTQGIGHGDDISGAVHFTLTGDKLTLDDFAHLQFGARVTSIGDPAAQRNDSEKIVAIAPAAPDAQNDYFKIFEDGASGLDSPSKTPTAVNFKVLTNDTDADGDQLIITDVHQDAIHHGKVEIASDGRSILYTPDLDFSGSDTFEYCVSDGHGGQDNATVNVSIAAVADLPAFDVQVLPGADVYHFTLKVTTTQNDADSSEFIDRIDATLVGATNGATIVPFGGINPGDQPDEIVQQFAVTLLPNQDTAFDINIAAFSQETTNGDQQVASKTIPIELDFNHNFFNPTFTADDQNIWGTGEAFNFHKEQFFGLDQLFDPPQLDFPIPPTPFVLFGDARIDAKVGFDFEVSITGGEFDATVPFDVTLNTAFNKTTEQLLVDPTFAISASGATLNAMGPGGFLSIDPIFDVQFDLQAGLDLFIDTLNLVNIHQPINPDLPGLTLSTDDAAVTFPLSPGFSLSFDFPEVDPMAGPSPANPLVAHDSSDNFVQINLDVDEFAANFFPPIAALSVPILFAVPLIAANVTGSVLLFDADVAGGLNVLQDLSLQMGLKGTLTFEDGSPPQTFNFGTPFTINNILDKDLNGDGKIDFGLTVTPDMKLTNNTDININIDLSLVLFQISGTFSPLVGDDTKFNEAVVNFHQPFDIASIPVLHGTPFDVLFSAPQQFEFMA
jgi:hypothetical protein